MEQNQSNTPQLVQSLEAIDNTTFANAPVQKAQLLQAAKALITRLQDPWERIYDLVFINPVFTSTLKIATDICLWTHLSSTAQSYTTLAAKTGTDPALLRRILRVLSASQVIEEVDIETYRHGVLSSALQDPQGLVNGIPYYYHTPIKQHQNLPKYFAEQGYQNPTSAESAPWKSMVGRPEYEGSRWQYLQEESPDESRLFNALLASVRQDQAPWPSVYPIAELLENFDPSTPFLVDVGGGNGRDVTQLAQHLAPTHPEAQIVLQDQGAVIEAIPKGTLPAQVECQAHDFFKPNPTPSARIYFLHSILHDWPTNEAVQILQTLTPSMTPSYSKVLLMERIMPTRARETSPLTATMDLQMMCNFASMERTESQWRDLIETAGLRVARIVPMVGYCMIEAEL